VLTLPNVVQPFFQIEEAMKYYQKLTLLLCLTWGFLGVQRVIISVIMPAIKADLELSNRQVGWVVAVTGLVWAFGTVFWAALGDRYGRRPIIVICTVLSAIFSWVTGFVHSLAQMLTIRGLLGLFEGGPYAPAMAVLAEESPENRRAMNAGLVTGAFMLIGVGFGSLFAGELMERFGSWRPVFYVVSTPAIALGIILYFVMRETPSTVEAIRLRKEGRKVESDKKAEKTKVIDALKYRNVVLSSINSIPVMGWLYIYTVFSALYLNEVHKFDMLRVTYIMAASGVGGFLGEFIMGSISDVIGRKNALILSALLCSGFGITVVLMPVGTSVIVFSTFFFLYGLFGAGMYPMYLGTLPAESVPPQIAGTAVGIPVAIGETLGAAGMPAIAGELGDMFNLSAPMWMAALTGIVIAFVSLFYLETAPAVVAKMKHKPTREDHIIRAFR
jgi:MFS family permease